MAYTLYKILHVAGIFAILLAIGGMVAVARSADRAAARRVFGILHGAGMLVSLVGGFGALARGGYGFPGWVIVKIGLWFLLGAFPSILKRRPNAANAILGLALLFAIAAFALALTKPF